MEARGDGEGHHEVGAGQMAISIVAQPQVPLLGLTDWAMAIAAGAIGEFLGAAVGALEQVLASPGSTTGGYVIGCSSPGVKGYGGEDALYCIHVTLPS
jgi:hypothetical protein